MGSDAEAVEALVCKTSFSGFESRRYLHSLGESNSSRKQPFKAGESEPRTVNLWRSLGLNGMPDTPTRATCLYLGFTLLFSAVIWALIIWSGHLGMAFGMMITAIMWCPALGALAACRVLGRSFRSLAWRWPEGRYIAAAYFVPLAYAAIAYGAVWTFRLAGWNGKLVDLVTERFGVAGHAWLGGVHVVVVVHRHDWNDSYAIHGAW